MSKQLYRIENALYNQTWCILPSVHNAMVNQLKQYQAGLSADIGDDYDLDSESDNATNLMLPDNVALINVDGVIGKHLSMLETQCGGVDVDSISAQLNAAASDTNIDSILMYYNTPGGSVQGVAALGELISTVSQTKDVIGYADCLCASAGMWLASQCTSFYCAPDAQIGSIGVYCLLLDETVALANEGVKVNAISAGKYKLSGASFQSLTDEERAMFQADVDKTYKAFKAAVTAKRDVADEDMQGQVFDGDTAVSKNLADGTLNSIQDLVASFSNN